MSLLEDLIPNHLIQNSKPFFHTTYLTLICYFCLWFSVGLCAAGPQDEECRARVLEEAQPGRQPVGHIALRRQMSCSHRQDESCVSTVEAVTHCIPQHPQMKLSNSQTVFLGTLCNSPPHCPWGTAPSLLPSAWQYHLCNCLTHPLLLPWMPGSSEPM